MHNCLTSKFVNNNTDDNNNNVHTYIFLIYILWDRGMVIQLFGVLNWNCVRVLSVVVTELLKHLDGINDVDCQASYRVAVKNMQMQKPQKNSLWRLGKYPW